MTFNLHGVRAIYRFEMNRALRTWAQSIIAPVLTTSLYFIVFGSAIGSRMGDIGGVDYGAYIIPGLLMLSLLSESISNSAFGIYMPLVGALGGLAVAAALGLDQGTGALFVVLCASASYIAVPAAMRLALPQAKAAIYLPLSLAITFPFNIVAGLPLYVLLAESVLAPAL